MYHISIAEEYVLVSSGAILQEFKNYQNMFVS